MKKPLGCRPEDGGSLNMYFPFIIGYCNSAPSMKSWWLSTCITSVPWQLQVSEKKLVINIIGVQVWNFNKKNWKNIQSATLLWHYDLPKLTCNILFKMNPLLSWFILGRPWHSIAMEVTMYKNQANIVPEIFEKKY